MKTEAKRKIGYDRRILPLVIILLVFGAYYIPLTLNIPVSAWTTGYYNAIQSLKPGDIVWIDWQWATKPDQYDYLYSILGHVWSKNVKIVWIDHSEASKVLGEEARKMFWGPDWATNPRVVFGVPMVYGENFVYLGYLPASSLADVGIEIATMIEWIKNPKSITSTDYRGTPVTNIPLMMSITEPSDFAICLNFGGSYFGGAYGMTIAKLLQENGIKAVLASNTAATTGYTMNYYNTGYILGIIAGARGGYEYMALTGIPNMTRAYLNGGILCSFLMIGGMIIANIYYAARPKPALKTTVAKKEE